MEIPYPAVESICKRIGGISWLNEKTFAYDFSCDKWVRSKNYKEKNVAVQINTNDLVSDENINELDKLVVKSTSEL